MADYTHGDMNIDVQEKTFNGFVKFVGRTIIFILCLLIFIALVDG